MKHKSDSTDSANTHAESPPAHSETLNTVDTSCNLERSKCPVFVVGCPRSGTTLLYHMLLSAGGFAVYRTESSVFNVLQPRFGTLEHSANRRRLMDAWIRSRLFERSGLDETEIRQKVMAECRSFGSFMGIVMDEIARHQNARRWADCTPEHILYVPQIKSAFPNALVIHIIRDGRDVALSLEKQGWIRPLLPGSRSALLAAGLYWQWMVNKGRKLHRAIPSDYLEIHFEDLVLSPHETLKRISKFISQDLDYDKIQKTAIGSVARPNTSFNTDGSPDEFSPAGRWKAPQRQADVLALEAALRGTLEELGYSSSGRAHQRAISVAAAQAIYCSTFEAKLFFKKHTTLGQFFMSHDLSWL